jgi:hypothetical protein
MVHAMLGRRFIRWFATAVLAGLVLTTFFGVVGEFFIEFAREKGVYQNPSQRLGVAMTALSDFVTQVWFIGLTTFSAGLAVGLWVDTLLRRREQDKPLSTVDSRALGRAAIDLSEKLSVYLEDKSRSPFPSFRAPQGEITSMLTLLEKAGVPTSEATKMGYSETRISWAMELLAELGPMMRDGNIEKARERAEIYQNQFMKARALRGSGTTPEPHSPQLLQGTGEGKQP